jgi:hypothetical protein
MVKVSHPCHLNFLFAALGKQAATAYQRCRCGNAKHGAGGTLLQPQSGMEREQTLAEWMTN